MSRIVRAPATWLTMVVGISTLVRVAIGLGVPSPWILPDEVVYSELAKSIAEGSRPAVRGAPVFGWGEVYPTLISPAWVLFEDPFRAYRAALAINALVMSLAAVPAYFLARMFVSRRSSVIVAAMTVLVPSMSYTAVVMTENAFYPVFLLAVLMIARAVRTPSIVNQALALAGLVLVAFTRIQGVALVGAYVAGIVILALTGSTSERGGYLRRFAPTAALAVLLPLAPVAVSLARGQGAFGWLGARSGTFDAFRPQEIPEWSVYLTAGLVLYVAVAPALATAVVIGQGLTRRAACRVRLFAAVGVPTFAAIIVSVAFVSASLDVDGTENLNERYVFYLVPLFIIGLAIWIETGLSKPRPWVWVIVAAGCLLPAILPIDRLQYNAGFQSVALVPWLSIDLSRVALGACVLAFTLFCGVVWTTCRRNTVGRLWLLLATTLIVVGVVTRWSNQNSASNSASAFGGQSPTWIDDALPPGEHAAVLWDTRFEGVTSPGRLYFWIMVAEVLNRSVGDVYRLGRPTYYEGFLPTVPARLGADAHLRDAGGALLSERYMLVTCRTPVRGRTIAQLPGGELRLVEATQPLRLATRSACSSPSP